MASVQAHHVRLCWITCARFGMYRKHQRQISMLEHALHAVQVITCDSLRNEHSTLM